MNITAEEIQMIAQQLAAVAGVFSPANAASIALLTQTATGLNILVQRIRAQNEANQKEVWQEVRRDFGASLAAFEKSINTKQGDPQ